MESLLARAYAVADEPCAWQRVIHGDCLSLRRIVTRQLVERKGPKAAYRYALCGLGDKVKIGGGECRVVPMGCGHRLCPRCGRKYGAKIVQRVCHWLAAEPHGDLFSHVLTQRVRTGETLKEARDRMRAKQDKYLESLRYRGMYAAIAATHIVWSSACGGWHYHVHVLMELPAGTTTVEWLQEKWRSMGTDAHGNEDGESCRLVIAAGGPIEALAKDDGSLDFWKHDSDAVARAVQYPLRDVAQGISAVRMGGDEAQMSACVSEMLDSATGWRLRTTLGKWKTTCPTPLPTVEAGGDDEAPFEANVGPAAGTVRVAGTVQGLYRLALEGNLEAAQIFRMLELTIRNDSEFARRFVDFCTRAGRPLFRVLNDGP